MEQAYARAEQSCSESSWRSLGCNNPESPSGGVMDPKSPGVPSVTELGWVWDAVLAPAQPAQSQGRVTLCVSHCRAPHPREGWKGALHIYPAGMIIHIYPLLTLEVFSTWSTIREIFMSINTWILSLFQMGARWRQNISLILKTSSEQKSWCPARPTPQHIFSHAICKGICNLSLGCL